MGVHRSISIILWLLVASAIALLSVSFAFGQGARTAQAEENPEPTVEGEVVGGNAVANGEYPFVVAILDRRVRGSAYHKQFCGGTLIDRNSVLTAAHCVRGVRPNRLNVTVGRTVLDSKQGTTRRVVRIFIHPKYDARSLRHDAAVLKLKTPVRKIRPARIPTVRQNYLERKGSWATVAGWGNTIAQPIGGSSRINRPNRMRKAQVPIRTDRYARSVYKPSYVPRLMIAAGSKGRDTCQGDSGGPMFKKAHGRYYQIGITSFGAGCGAPGYPGVYTETNASPNRSFIMKASRS